MNNPKRGGRLAPSEVRRLFILRPDNLGDVVLFTGALRHLRSHYGNAQITLCVRRYVGPLLRDCPHIDRLVFWEDLHQHWPEWTRRVRGLSRMELALRRWQIRHRYVPDVALLPLRSPAAEMHDTLRVLGARESYGIRGCHSNQSPAVDAAAEDAYTERLSVPPSRAGEHELVITAEFLSMLGIEVGRDDLDPEFWSDGGDRQWADAQISAAPGTRLLVIAPGVTAPPEKAYAPEHYRRILEAVEQARFSVALLGTASDAAACDIIERSLAGSPRVAALTNLVGRTSVRNVVEVLARADLILGPDSAIVHMGVALDRPTLCILGGGQFGRFHPWGDPDRNRSVYRRMECFGCDWQCRYPTMRCVAEIAPEDIGAELADLLQSLPAAEGVHDIAGNPAG